VIHQILSFGRGDFYGEHFFVFGSVERLEIGVLFG